MIRPILILLVLFAGAPVLAQTALPDRMVIAHRGASAERPEHTRAAYELAIDQGADVIEPDLVMSRDGVLVVRHENEIGETTNVAQHPGFADRRRTATIDGRPVTGWFAEDFTLDELKTLRTRERLPMLRPASAAFDGQGPILTFEEVLDIAAQASARTGRVIGVAPELKHPSHLASQGLDMEAALVATLRARGLDRAEAPIFVQCFEAGPLERLNTQIDTRLIQLISPVGGPADRPGVAYADMTTDAGLASLAAHVDGIGVEATLVLPRDAHNGLMAPSDLTARAQAHGLKVLAWTFRPENIFLPTEFRRGEAETAEFPGLHGDLDAYLNAAWAAGVDGLFSDLVPPAVATRP